MAKNESLFVEGLIKFFSPYFIVKEEVWTKDRSGRIDLVLKHSSDVYFGVECKPDDSKRGEEIGEYVKQAIRYSTHEFEIEPNYFKRIPILICPPLSYKYFLLNEHEKEFEKQKWHRDRHLEDHEHHTFNGFLGVWAVGELRKAKNELQTWFYIAHSNKPVWSNKRVYDWNQGRPIKSSERIAGLDRRWYDDWMRKIKSL